MGLQALLPWQRARALVASIRTTLLLLSALAFGDVGEDSADVEFFDSRAWEVRPVRNASFIR